MLPLRIVVLLLALPALAGAEELRLDARTLYEKGVTQGVRLAADGKAVELDEGDLIEDDGPAAGYSYKPNEERLSAHTWARKELLVADPRARKATLLVGPGGQMRIAVNGKPADLRAEPRKVGGYWQAYPLPVEMLRKGKNEIVLSGGGRVWIARDEDYAAGSRTRTRHPNRSARSADGGKTWSHDRLGADGSIDGEYCVRLFLHRHVSSGTLTLPVLDLGNLAGAAVAPPIASVGPVRVGVEADGTGGTVTLRARSGPTLATGGKGWSEWSDLKPGVEMKKPHGRYLQLALTLRTADPLRSPTLKRVTINASPKRAAEWGKDVRVVERQVPDITRTSIPFEYEPFDHGALKELRAKYRLDDVVKGAKGEFELVTRLAAWSARRWEKGHLREAYPTWNALDILQPHRDGTPVGGFCQQHNLVFLQACQSFGILGRAVSIGPGDHGSTIRGGHEVVEMWSNEYRKWVHVDGDSAWYFRDTATKVPLSLRELRERQLRASKNVEVVKLAEGGREWKGLDGWPAFHELRLIPRSNFLEKTTPLPLNQGMRGWFWPGHHVWTDSTYPASLLYGRRVSKPGNWDWTLNQVRCVLEATATPGELLVHLDTETPGFESYLAAINGAAAQPVATGFVWKLRQGKNTLEVRARNKIGREGPVSRIVLAYR